MRKEKIKCFNGNNKISGELYLPEGTGPFPLLIYSHGYGYNWQVISMQRLAEHGIAACCFDFCGGSPWAKSSGKSTDMSVLTEADDLETVLNTLKEDKRIDRKRIYLCGNSQGGYVSTVVGIRRREEISGLFLMCPAFVITDFKKQYLGGGEPAEKMRFGNLVIGKRYIEDIDRFPVYEEMKKYTGPIVIYHGTNDEMVPLSYSQRAVSSFSNSTLKVLPGTGHMLSGYGRQIEDEIINMIMEV